MLQLLTLAIESAQPESLPSQLAGNGTLAALLFALVGTAAVFVWRMISVGRRQDEATTAIIKNQVEFLVKPLREQVQSLREDNRSASDRIVALEKKNDDLEIDNETCKIRVTILTHTLREHGIEVPREVDHEKK